MARRIYCCCCCRCSSIKTHTTIYQDSTINKFHVASYYYRASALHSSTADSTAYFSLSPRLSHWIAAYKNLAVFFPSIRLTVYIHTYRLGCDVQGWRRRSSGNEVQHNNLGVERLVCGCATDHLLPSPPPLVELDSTQKRNNVNFFLSQLAHLRVVDSIDWIISLRCYKLNHPPFFFNFLQLMMADVVSNESRRVWLDLFIYLWLLRADFREKTKKKTFDSCSVQKKGTRGLANDEKEANVMKDSIYIRASVGGWLLLFNPRLFPLSPPPLDPSAERNNKQRGGTRTGWRAERARARRKYDRSIDIFQLLGVKTRPSSLTTTLYSI